MEQHLKGIKQVNFYNSNVKKFLVIIILFSFGNAVSANSFTTYIKQCFESPDKKFIRAEQKIYTLTIDDANQKINNIWFMKDENINKIFKSSMRTRYSIKKDDGIYYSYPDRAEEFEKLAPQTFDKAFEVNNKYIQEYYNDFLKNKNNMENNKQIYDDLYNDFIIPYSELSKYIMSIYKNAFFNYQNNLYEKTENLVMQGTDGKYYQIYNCSYYSDPKRLTRTEDREFKCYIIFNNLENVKTIKSQEELTNQILQQNNYALQIGTIFNKNSEYLQKIQNEIKNYSVEYETKKAQNFYKSYGNIKKCNGTFNTYFSIGYPPEKGCYYDLPIEIFQKVPNGYLILDPLDYNGLAFIQSNKNYQRGTQIQARLLYQGGTYNYISLLGENLSVYKYKIINIPKEKFFFVDK